MDVHKQYNRITLLKTSSLLSVLSKLTLGSRLNCLVGFPFKINLWKKMINGCFEAQGKRGMRQIIYFLQKEELSLGNQDNWTIKTQKITLVQGELYKMFFFSLKGCGVALWSANWNATLTAKAQFPSKHKKMNSSLFSTLKTLKIALSILLPAFI